MTSSPLNIENLAITIAEGDDAVEAVKSMSLDLAAGEVLALVGESGSGKTITARAVLGLLPARASTKGVILINGISVLEATPEQGRKVRGEHAAMIFQEPSTALNPVFTIGWQMSEGLRAHGISDVRERRRRSIELLTAVGIPSPETRIDDYPHQFSGGQKQRIVIAMALALRPAVIIADEPTTALDVTVQAEILDLLRRCRDELGASILLITHNMGVVADLADRVAVMYQGELVEVAPVEELFASPREQYTQDLLAAVPRLGAEPREARDEGIGDVVYEAENLDIVYSGGFRQKPFHAVHGVSFTVRRGEVFGLVGESGSGKSTIGRSIVGLAPVSGGSAKLLGSDLRHARGAELRELRRRVGFVFQDPASSFNSLMTVGECIEEPMRIHRAGSRQVRERRVNELLDAVQLPRSMAFRHPYELSGGQRQRVGLARALVLDPEFLVADEPTSALDVSVQARVLEIFNELQRDLGFGCLFISHDLAVVEMLSDRIGVLQSGRLVEAGTASEVLQYPKEAYTRRLIAAVPVPDPKVQRARRPPTTPGKQPLVQGRLFQ
ncbi:dipeptide ABC transporter ATP-binding protein [Agromyces italicus]|uniref:dipeptide ABC transporter ATP-binding protein n=1 Tax=Agromyces italicus TaxID=279572 RepID=UPI0003B537A7|nr:ABC transporter ATP-binding protein [Agromyces italicus]